MSDSTTFINAYVENSVSMLHEYVTLVLQLKTQIKVTGDMLVEKDQHIVSLQQQIESNKLNLDQLNEKINEMSDVKNKFDQVNNMVVEKDQKISNLEKTLKLIMVRALI